MRGGLGWHTASCEPNCWQLPAPGQVTPGPGPAITIHHDKSGHQIWRQRERAGERATGDSALFAMGGRLVGHFTHTLALFPKSDVFMLFFWANHLLARPGSYHFLLALYFCRRITIGESWCWWLHPTHGTRGKLKKMKKCHPHEFSK